MVSNLASIALNLYCCILPNKYAEKYFQRGRSSVGYFQNPNAGEEPETLLGMRMLECLFWGPHSIVRNHAIHLLGHDVRLVYRIHARDIGSGP
ncbi:MAG: hypothetical protein Ct9H90mP14_3370 [Methanobacteriota archaeon]|nr:MAG: hypothetical protein Ct9H90mP14_3370 [Euryarchaeota archaeon]